MKLFLLSVIVFSALFTAFIHKDIGKKARLQAYFHEPKIYYRLARSDTSGIFSDAGLLGFCDSGLSIEARHKYCISLYLSGKCPQYFPYMSQSGLQGLLYSLINKFYKNPLIFRIICASFLSAVLTAWFLWLRIYFGLIPSFLTIMIIPFFQDLTLYGDNIAQVLGATYLIMVAMFWAYEKKIKNLGAVAFFAVLLKLLLNGPEYIFSALLLPYLPLIFYAILNMMPFAKFTEEILAITKGVVLACFIALLILMAQVSAVDSPIGALHFFVNKAMARTFNPSLLSPDQHDAVINCYGLKLLCRYFTYPCISTGIFRISYGLLIFFFNIMSILALYLYCCFGQRILLALLATTWASILCPLAWILIAEGHSATHIIDSLVWNIPFTLFGMTLTIVTLQRIISVIL